MGGENMEIRGSIKPIQMTDSPQTTLTIIIPSKLVWHMKKEKAQNFENNIYKKY